MANLYPILLCVVLCELVFANPVVKAPAGTINGIDASFEKATVEQFLGIPYAKPPVDALRFQYPIEFGPLGNFQANKFGSVCVQSMKSELATLPTPESEDCLTLNIFRKKDTKEGDQKPVVFIIHGGAFSAGAGSDMLYDPIPFVSLGDVVAVTINYRLGVFGFADMDDLAPANLGLFDQKMAIEWVHKNIKSFGGDPNKVTLWGVSAGSMSVSAQILTPLNRGKNLFQGAIMDGGVLAAGIVFPPGQNLEKVKILAQKVNCPTNGVRMLDCLKKVDAKKLALTSYDPEVSSISTFQPSIDGKFIINKIGIDLRDNSHKYLDVNVLIGYALDEGTMFAPYYKGKTDVPIESKTDFINWCKKVANGFMYYLNFDNVELQNLVADTYYEKSQSRLHDVADFITDGTFSCPVNAFAKKYSKYHKNVYMYHFQRKLAQKYAVLDPDRLGAFHGSPFLHMLGSLLRLPSINPIISINEKDEAFMKDFMSTVREFLDHEKAPSFRGVVWPSLSKKEGILVLNEEPEIIQTYPNLERCAVLFHYYEPRETSKKVEL